MSIDSYDQFIAGKLKRADAVGFDVSEDAISKTLYDWQRRLVVWALRKGRATIAADCGLGKTMMQLEWARMVKSQTAKPVLILAPLAVAKQTANEAHKLWYTVNVCRTGADFLAGAINVTNYDRLDEFESIIPTLGGVVLDESSILKSFTGKTRIQLTQFFSATPYRLCATATPAPNDYTELGQHADFLGLMTPAQMLATWFVNDTANTGDWRLKKHAEDDFWRWVSSWMACVSKPSDIGGDDARFELPPMTTRKVVVHVDQRPENGSESLFIEAASSATSIHKELRRTMTERCAAAVKLIRESDPTEPWVVFCETNDESGMLGSLIEGAVEVTGSMSIDAKEKALDAFSEGRARVIVSKPSICGFGMNWQHCRNILFVSYSYSFEKFYQAVRRVWRFGQKREVNCYIIQTDTENNVLPTIQRKLEAHDTMKEAMKFTSEELSGGKPNTVLNEEIHVECGKRWTAINGDCVRGAKTIADECVGFSVFSPPFADLFTYSNDVQDMGNCGSVPEFIEQFGFLVNEINRIMMPGREVAVHCCDLLSTKWKHGKIEFQDFSGELIRAFRKVGFTMHSRITIWKDPVTEMQRTKAHGLLYKTLRTDSSNSRVGAPDYLLVFRKPGDNPKPITHNESTFPLDLWQEIASPVWRTVRQTRVLDYECARDEKDEKHICPLQLDVIERALTLWSAPDDLVFSPFMGIGSEGYCAVKMGRRFVGTELKPSYFERAVHNLKTAQEEATSDLFKTKPQ